MIEIILASRIYMFYDVVIQGITGVRQMTTQQLADLARLLKMWHEWNGMAGRPEAMKIRSDVRTELNAQMESKYPGANKVA